VVAPKSPARAAKSAREKADGESVAFVCPGGGGLLSGNLVLEPRMMFDGAAAAIGGEAVDAAHSLPTGAESADGAVDDAGVSGANGDLRTDALISALDAASSPDMRNGGEIVFVDPSVADYEELVSGLGAAVEVVVLDGDGDGVEQMASVLDGRSGVEAVHIIAHGTPGTLELGTTNLTAASISGEHADALTVIGRALSEDADILVYGCNFASGSEGREALRALADATGADIAASDDVTGAAFLGGDWDLEVRTGGVESDALVANSWAHVLEAAPAASATGDEGADTALQAADSDGDGVADAVDLDDDNDGIPDDIENAVSVPLDGWGESNPQTFEFEQGSLTVSQSDGTITVAQLDGIDVVKWGLDSRTFQTFTFEFSAPVTDFRATIFDLDTVEYLKIEAYRDGQLYEIGPEELILGSNLSFNEYGTIVNEVGSAPKFSSDPAVQVHLVLEGPIDRIVVSARETASTGRNFGFSNPTFVMGGKDTDGDGVPDSLDLDSDNDGISDLIESGQDASIDADGDGRRDDMASPELAAGNDLDGDGLADAVDNGNELYPVNTDASGPFDYLDLDSDGDTIPDAVEARPTNGYVSPTQVNNAANAGVNDDGLHVPVDTDGDGIADYRDGDSDDDGTEDLNESGLTNLVGDLDGDGIEDARGASYADPDGEVNDPSSDLPNQSGDTAEVAYREGNNTPPVLNADPDGSSGAVRAGDYVTTWTENDAPVSIVDVTDALLLDAQDDPVALAVTLIGGMAGDALLFPDVPPAGITASISSPATLSVDGDLTVVFSGDPATTTSADWQTLLRSLALLPSSTAPETPDPAVRTIAIQATDSAGEASNVITTTVNVVPVNDPVRVVAALPEVNAQDGSGAFVVGAASAFDDADGDALTYALGDDAPSWLSIDPATGVISLAESIPAAASATSNMPAGQPGEYEVTVIATDPAGAEASTGFRIRVANVPPAAVADVSSEGEDAQRWGDVLANDADGAPDGDQLTVTEVNGSAALVGRAVALEHGTLLLNADGSWSFTPNAAANGLAEGETVTEVVSYTVSDGQGGTDGATLSITLVGSNDAPVVVDPADPGEPGAPAPAPDPYGVLAVVDLEDGQEVGGIDVSAPFRDPEGEKMTFSATGLPEGLMMDPVAGVVTGTLAGDASIGGPGGDGRYEVVIRATDGAGQSAETTLVLQVANVPPENVVPLPDLVMRNGEVVEMDTARAFADRDGDVLTYSAAGLPEGLSIDPATGLISGRVALDASRHGPYRVVVAADDGQGGVARTAFEIDVVTALVMTPESGGGNGGGASFAEMGDTHAGEGDGNADGASGAGDTELSLTQAVEELGDLGSIDNRGGLSALNARDGISPSGGMAMAKSISQLSGRSEHAGGRAMGRDGLAGMDRTLQGGSSMAMSLGPETGDALVIRTLALSDGLLAIDMSVPDGRGGRTLPEGLKVFAADGTELPWNFRGDSSGTLLVDIPAGREWLDLRIERPVGDGATESWEIRVNLRSGEIVRTEQAERRAFAPGFLDDVERMAEGERQAAELLMRALVE